MPKLQGADPPEKDQWRAWLQVPQMRQGLFREAQISTIHFLLIHSSDHLGGRCLLCVE